MQNSTVSWVVILLMLVTKTAGAQSVDRYFFRYLTKEDGLIHNNVFDITQDKKGFIWIATSNGLQRYDGYRFRQYRDMLNDPSIVYSGPVTMCEDPESDVFWINKGSTTEKVDAASGQITYYHPQDLIRRPEFASAYYRSTDGVKLYLGPKAIFFQLPTSQSVDIIFGNLSATNRSSGNFSTNDETGETVMGSSAEGLTLFEPAANRIYKAGDTALHHPLLQALHKAFGPKQFLARHVMFDSHHNLWFAAWGNFFCKYDASTHRIIRYSLPKNAAASCFYEDNHQTLWVCTERAGVLRYDASADRFIPILSNDNDKVNDLTDREFNCITQDREDNIWLGSDKGVAVFNPYRQYFQYIHHDESNKASLPKDEVDCVIQTRTVDILAGSWGGGITVYDSSWRFLRNISFDQVPDYNLIWCFVQHDDGSIWAGCQHGYLHIYDPVSGHVRTIRPPETEGSTIRCMAKDRNGNIWLGLHNGKIVEWNKQDKQFKGYHDTAAGREHDLSSVVAIFLDSKQRCWVSTDRGLKQFNLVTRKYVSTYLPDKNRSYQIRSYAPKGMEEWNDSTLLVGTLYGGLHFFNPQSGRFKPAPFHDSLLYNNVYAVKKDAAGYCWFTTDYGICSFRPEDGKIIRYNLGTGIINSAFNSFHFDTLQNGDWVTSTETGIVVFHPGAVQKKDPSKVEITGFKIFDSAVAPEMIGSGQPIRLDHTRNFITIEFARLRFSDLHQNNYYYRMKGVNDEWINAGTNAFATYTNLSPGHYQFEVRADDGDGGGVTAVTSFPLIITPPFWKTWWFLCLVSLLTAYTLFRLIRWRLEVLSVNEKLSIAKLEALRSQMNPHFVFNCLTSIDNLIQTGEKGKATVYLAKFARLIRSILETSKVNSVACWKDMEALALYLEMEELRCDGKFSYTIKIAPEISNGDYRVPPMVIQPFVENAIHHGLLNKRESSRELLIAVDVSKEYVCYIIEDNGVGREKALEYRRLNKPAHQSMGVQISTDRIDLYNQYAVTGVVITDLYDAAGQASGTRVQVNIINQS